MRVSVSHSLGLCSKSELLCYKVLGGARILFLDLTGRPFSAHSPVPFGSTLLEHKVSLLKNVCNLYVGELVYV